MYYFVNLILIFRQFSARKNREVTNMANLHVHSVKKDDEQNQSERKEERCHPSRGVGFETMENEQKVGLIGGIE